MPEQQKIKNPFDSYYKDYEKTLKDIAQEEANLRKELKKEEERIRHDIKKNFTEVKETFEERFETSLVENQNGVILIKMQHSFSLKFIFEVEQRDNKFQIKLSSIGEVGDYKYSRFALPMNSTVSDYSQFVKQTFTSFLNKFNEFIYSVERDRMLERLRQEVKKP